jgi:DNA-binding response OmpR family regulator
MKRKILLADDDSSVRKSLANVLESEGFEVRLAEDGRQAVREFLAEQPDLVLLDINMPDKSGWEAFRLMETLHPFVPVIVITARPNQFERAVLEGVDALMEKPLDLLLLVQTIQRLLSEGEPGRIERLAKKKSNTEFLSPEFQAPHTAWLPFRASATQAAEDQ